MSEETEDFDIVVDTLQKTIDKFQKMIRDNIRADMFNLMDEIRIEQITQLEKAIKMWERAKNV
jgi:hypothetical protein